MEHLARATYSLDDALARTLHDPSHMNQSDVEDSQHVEGYFEPLAVKQTAFLPVQRACERAPHHASRNAAMCSRHSAKTGRAGGNSLDSSASSSPNGLLLDSSFGQSDHKDMTASLERHMHLLTVHVDEEMMTRRPLEAVDEEADEERYEHHSTLRSLGIQADKTVEERQKAGRVPVPSIETKPALADRRQRLAHPPESEEPEELEEADIIYDMALVTRWVEYHRALAAEQRQQFETSCAKTSCD